MAKHLPDERLAQEYNCCDEKFFVTDIEMCRFDHKCDQFGST